MTMTVLEALAQLAKVNDQFKRGLILFSEAEQQRVWILTRLLAER